MLVFGFRGFSRLSQVKSYHTASLEDYSIVSMSAYARIRSYIHFILAGGSGVSLWDFVVACSLAVVVVLGQLNSGQECEKVPRSRNVESSADA